MDRKKFAIAFREWAEDPETDPYDVMEACMQIYRSGFKRLNEKHTQLIEALQTAVDALMRTEHANDCRSYDEEPDGEIGTGPWDTAMKPGPCTCGKAFGNELLSTLNNLSK
jgi:hypothetical protein